MVFQSVGIHDQTTLRSYCRVMVNFRGFYSRGSTVPATDVSVVNNTANEANTFTTVVHVLNKPRKIHE